MTVQKVFLVRSACARIREVEAEIVSGPKMTWAIVKKKRFLLGATAFFTMKSAEVRKLGLLRKIVESGWAPRMQPYLYGDALVQIKRFKESKVFH